MPPKKIDLLSAGSEVEGTWTPHVLAELNGQLVKLARTEGAFVWHQHDAEDELFYVVQGHLDIHFEDGTVGLDPGELCVVPRGLRHKPEGEALILLFEPKSTRNTGEVDSDRTIEAGALPHLSS